MELVLVFAVLAAIGLFAVLLMPKVRVGYDAQRAGHVLSGAVGAVEMAFPNKNYSNLTTSVAAGGDIFPDSYTDGTSITSEWGGAIDVCGANASATCTTNSARFVRFDYHDVPGRVCEKLLPHMQDTFFYMMVNGVVVFNKQAGMAFNAPLVSTQCRSQDQVDIVLMTG